MERHGKGGERAIFGKSRHSLDILIFFFDLVIATHAAGEARLNYSSLEVAMKRLLNFAIALALIITPIKQLEACTSPNVGEKKANLHRANGWQYTQPLRPVWTCTASSGSYKIHVGVTSAGAGGTYVFELYDRTDNGQVLQRSFTTTGNCGSGDFTVSLVNGHEYELMVDLLSGGGTSDGEQAWVKMCYSCQGS